MGKVCFMPVMVDLSMFCPIFGGECVMPSDCKFGSLLITNPLIHGLLDRFLAEKMVET